MSMKGSFNLDSHSPSVDKVFMADQSESDSSRQSASTSAYFGKGKFRLFGHYVHGQFLFLALFEFFVLAGAVCLIHAHLRPDPLAPDFAWVGFAAVAALYSLVVFAGLTSVGLYDTRQRERLFGIALRIGLVVVFAYSLTITFMTYAGSISAAGSFGMVIILGSLACLAATRVIFYRYLDGKILRRKVLVLGVGEKAAYIDRLRRKSDKRGFKLLGYVASKGCELVRVDSDGVLRIDSSICSYAFTYGIDEIVVALDQGKDQELEEELLNCRMKGIQVTDIADFFERERAILHVDLVQADWLIFGEGFNRGHGASIMKRLLDIIVSVALLLITLPIILLTALSILLESRGRGAVLYKQERVGRGGRVFNVYKFRSMVTNAEVDGVARWAQEQDSRITKVGGFIRKYRIDELPQLWNVLKGDMSLVGPRPERPQFVEQLNGVNALYSSRHNVDPGITGWAQLCYPYGSSEQDSIQKLQYDLYYVKNRGLFLDLYILAQTVGAVLFKKGAR